MQTKYKFHNNEYPVVGQLSLSVLFKNFISERNFKQGELISLITQVRYGTSKHYSLGHRFPINPHDVTSVNTYIDFITNKYAQLGNWYKDVNIHSIYFNYTLINQTDYDKGLKYISGVDTKVIKSLDINPLNLPNNTNYNSWGVIMDIINHNTTIIKNLFVDISTDLNRYIEVTHLSEKVVTVKLFSSISNILLSEFTDRISNSREFTRTIGNKTYHITDNIVNFMFENQYSSNFITKLRPHKGYDLNMITLDLETYLNNGVMEIYCCCFYDGRLYNKFYIADYVNIDSMIDAMFSALFTRTNSGKAIYIFITQVTSI